ncbi:hypothetical protein CEP54_011169 [Fusarium duplospermum]|uniref:Uncharacterized protein n=1 Tax=Fusarium duplospermum TaxID=1325734 RepID=A0A428PFX3_9HYPO|nr:hypothetical protein CEP54_011169 [Fusarium duplospermum]
MASELEGLIAGLLVHISCAGEQGCPVGDVLDAIHHPSKTHADPLSQLRGGDSAVQHRTASTIWSWLVSRRDISVGPNRKYNRLTLDEILALEPPADTNGQDAEPSESASEARTAPQHVLVYASEETMWESLTGHAVDYKRVPKSEWMLLLGIASTTTQGILQGDLGRLVDQDKRSVPKRTDALLKKGYIAKRTTLVRGTKTSKMWLKLFAPPLPKDGEGGDEVRPDMTLTRQVLVDNLDPVPWHIRWTGESIDYTALATTIMAIAKEWGVLRMTDMKSKLGVLGMRWQMKVLAKVCRFLNSRGVIQYVAAKLGEKVFKDCIKYVRDFNSEDWAVYLATGKKQAKTPRNPDLDGFDGTKVDGQTSNASEVAAAPPWSLDKPVPVIIAEMAQRLGDTGLTNPDVYALTLGPSYSRHLSSMTTALSVPNLQPAHLSHFQLRSEHTRTGKVASYRYFAQNDPLPPPIANGVDGSQAAADATIGHDTTLADSYGFSPIPTTSISDEPSTTLMELCNLGLATRRANKGRPKKGQAKKQKPAPATKGRGGRRQPKESPVPQQEQVAQEKTTQESETHETDTQENTSQGSATQKNGIQENDVSSNEARIEQGTAAEKPGAPSQSSTTHQETAPEGPESLNPDDAPSGPGDTGTLVATLKVSSDHLKDVLSESQPAVTTPVRATPARATRARSTRSSAKKAGTEIASAALDAEEIEDGDENEKDPEAEVATKNPLSNRKRGRPRRGETRKKGNAAEATDGDSGSKPWVCEKCGGSWKNDIGLKYHLEKSRTACNPSFDEATAGPVRRGKKRAIAEVEEPETPTPAENKSPQAEAPDEPGPEKEDQTQEVEEESFSTPARRVSKLRGPVARLSWSSRPTVSFKSDSFHVNPEWRRPPVTSFDSPKTPLSNGTNGALVQNEDGQPRPVLGPLHRLDLSASSPKTPRPRSQTKAPEPTAKTPQPKGPETNGHEGSNGALNGGSSAVKPRSPAVVDTPVSRAVLSARIRQIIQEILTEQSGVFPGADAIPQVRAYQAVLRDMLKNKVVAEHWHSFRSTKGMTEKCHVIVQAGVDPFSLEATNLLDKMKAAHPDTYIPPPFDALADHDLLNRGRRDLPVEVEMLDAPVYVARAAQKRALEELDDDDEDAPPPQKRGRRRKRAARDNSASPDRSSKRDDITFHEGYEAGQGKWYEHFAGVPESIQFLEPNTFLDEEPPRWLSKRASKAAARHVQEDETFNDVPKELVFDKPILVSGDLGAWPYISAQDFELQDASYTLKGWMPDMNWFAWSSILDVIDERALELKRQKRQHRTDLGRYQRFVERLQCCMDTERSWAESFIHAPRGAAGPHNTFVTFFSGADMELVDVPSLTWPSEWQLTPGSFPGAVPDRQLLVDSTSDEEDDSPEWTRLSIPQAGPGAESARTTTARQQQGQQARVKRVRLLTRALTTIPAEAEQSEGLNLQNATNDSSDSEEADRLLAAFVAVRVLLGGSDKAIDWGLLLKLFPSFKLKELRRFWITARRDQGAYIGKLTKDFQDKFLIAYQKEELPEFDFDDPLDYDWHELIDWTLQLPRRKGVDLPSTRTLLEENFTSHKASRVVDDWREKFHHVQSSVFSRFEATTGSPAVVAVDKMLTGLDDHVELTDRVIARSWVRSLCCTEDSRYSVDQIRQKFSSLAKGDQDRNNALLKQAIDDLTQQRIICRSKKAPLGGRPYRLNEWYYHMLGKLAQRTKYQEAADFKAKLDAVFRRGETFQVPYTLEDGAVMALTNLNASERIKLMPVDVPNIPLGFEPGNYESRKFPKSYYHFSIEAVPTDTYKYDEDIDVIRKTIYEGPPTAGKESVLPQWVDFFGRRDAQRWMDILGAFCFVFALRGYLSIEGVCSALKPVLEEFEAQMIIDWGKKTGVLKESEDGLGVTTGEWWWLAVPWQWGRQLRARGRREDD